VDVPDFNFMKNDSEQRRYITYYYFYVNIMVASSNFFHVPLNGANPLMEKIA